MTKQPSEPPKGPGWSDAPGGPGGRVSPDSIAHQIEIERLTRLREQLPQMLSDLNERQDSRSQKFLPYLLIRSLVGDRGDRPLKTYWWDSPDIWIVSGDPSNAPQVPSSHGSLPSVRDGSPYTLYAHVWNLGRAPVVGANVEFLERDWTRSDFVWSSIGVARVDLAPRSSTRCHQLAKCPKAWFPSTSADYSPILAARISAIGDPANSSPSDYPWLDRHVAYYSIYVFAPGEAGAHLDGLRESLNRARSDRSRVVLVQVGAEGRALEVVEPHLRVDPDVETQVLAELRADGSLHLAATQDTGSVNRANSVAEPLPVPRIDLRALFRTPIPLADLKAESRTETEILSCGADLRHLFAHAHFVRPSVAERLRYLPPPRSGQAQILRVVLMEDDLIVGGQTIIVRG